MKDNQNNIPDIDNSDVTVPNNTDNNTNSTFEDNNTEIPKATEDNPINEIKAEETNEEPPINSEEQTTEPQKEQYAFEWNYTTLTPSSSKPKRKKTGLIFGLIMAGVFALALTALVAAIIYGIMTGNFSLGTKNTVDYNTQINVSDNGPTDNDPLDASNESIEAFKHSTVVVLCDNSTGTGIILDDNGMIVTNHHVIEGATTITVFLYDGRNYTAKLIGSDAYNDIAVIKITAPNLVPAVFANSDDVYTSERVYAIGTPAGPEFAWSVSAGIVSHPSRELKFFNDEGKLDRSLFLIQTDALVNPGNSGGPLINTRCEVIGVVSMRLTDEYVGIGFAIPTNTALPIIASIIENYKEPIQPSSAPQLGIRGVAIKEGDKFSVSMIGIDIVTDNYYERHPDRCVLAEASGIYVVGFSEGFDVVSKLEVGDIIIGADGTTITTMDDLKNVIAGKRVGGTINLTVIRDGSELNYNVTLGKAPQ